MPTQQVGIIGLGLLGGALAERFLAAGFVVCGFDVNADRVAEFVGRGGGSVESTREIIRRDERVVLSLPNSDIVESVLRDIDGDLRPGQCVIDTTTGDPERTAAIGERLAARGVRYLDATVAGSSEQARTSEVIVMIGGERAAAEACADLFACFARRWFHLGTWGTGARMKLVVNLVLGLNRAALAEGLAFARACELDLDQTLEVLQSGAAYSRAMDAKGRKMIDGEFAPQARLAQHLKDVRLILAAAERAGASTPLSRLHRDLLESAVAGGCGELDNSAIIRVFENHVE